MRQLYLEARSPTNDATPIGICRRFHGGQFSHYGCSRLKLKFLSTLYGGYLADHTPAGSTLGVHMKFVLLIPLLLAGCFTQCGNKVYPKPTTQFSKFADIKQTKVFKKQVTRIKITCSALEPDKPCKGAYAYKDDDDVWLYYVFLVNNQSISSDDYYKSNNYLPAGGSWVKGDKPEPEEVFDELEAEITESPTDAPAEDAPDAGSTDSGSGDSGGGE